MRYSHDRDEWGARKSIEENSSGREFSELKPYLRRFERIICGELNVEEIDATGIGAVVRAHDRGCHAERVVTTMSGPRTERSERKGRRRTQKRRHIFRAELLTR